MLIVYFDGYCNLCNRFIDFLLRRDAQRRLKFAPLQGSTARARLPEELRNSLSTMVLEEPGFTATESTAALLTIAHLGGVYRAAKIGLTVPRWIRDPLYRLIAKRRYAIAGKRSSCRLPSAEERAQFLD